MIVFVAIILSAVGININLKTYSTSENVDKYYYICN